MGNKNNKKILYSLMDMYLSKKIDGKIFCKEFYSFYNLEISDEILDENEKKNFADLVV